MELDRYQRDAWRFDQQGADHPTGLTVSLLGLGGEIGDLRTSQKKRVRDGVTPSSAHETDTGPSATSCGTCQGPRPGSASTSAGQHPRT